MTLEIIILPPGSKHSHLVKGSVLVGLALELMIKNVPSYDPLEPIFYISETQSIPKDQISLCSLFSKLGALFNWTSRTGTEYSVVVLSSESTEFFQEIKSMYQEKEDLIL